MRRLIAPALALAAAQAAAEVYKCQAADGRISFSEQPCPGQRVEAVEVKPRVIDMTEFHQRLEAKEQERQKAQAEQAMTEAPRPPPGVGKTRACLQAKAALKADHSEAPQTRYPLEARERLFCSLRGEPVPGCFVAMEEFDAAIQAGANAKTLVPVLQNISEACGRPLPPTPEPRRPPPAAKAPSTPQAEGPPCPDDPAKAQPPLRFCIDADGRLECQ
jgi:hypothetical protein